MNQPEYIIVHHSASSRDRTTLQDIDSWHKLRWPDFKSSLGYYVGYHKLIMADGTVIRTRLDSEEGAHCLGGYNKKSLGICVAGNFDLEEPSEAQLNSLEIELGKSKIEYNISDAKILGHSQVWSTSCPGKNLLRWLNLYKQLTLLQKIFEVLKQLKVVKRIK